MKQYFHTGCFSSGPASVSWPTGWLDGPARIWIDITEFGFLSWARHRNRVVRSAELALAACDLHGRKCWSVSDLIETWQGAAMPASPAVRDRYQPDKSHSLHIPHIPRAVLITCQRGIHWAK